MDIETAFFKWLDSVLGQDIPAETVAFNFNLYEGSEPEFHVQLIGASEFAKDNQDWACAEVFSTGENIFAIPQDVAGEDWQQGLSYATNLVKTYLDKGEKRESLKSKKAVGVGFVDGDIEVIFENND